jgi:hypothetical protein
VPLVLGALVSVGGALDEAGGSALAPEAVPEPVLDEVGRETMGIPIESAALSPLHALAAAAPSKVMSRVWSALFAAFVVIFTEYLLSGFLAPQRVDVTLSAFWTIAALVLRRGCGIFAPDSPSARKQTRRGRLSCPAPRLSIALSARGRQLRLSPEFSVDGACEFRALRWTRPDFTAAC